MSAKVLFKQRTSKSFRVKTGVRQGCLLSLLLFLLVVDWVMNKVVGEGENGIKWVKGQTLDDLDFAGDLALLSHMFSKRRVKQQNWKKQLTKLD